MDRQTDRQTEDRQTDRQTDRWIIYKWIGGEREVGKGRYNGQGMNNYVEGLHECVNEQANKQIN